MQAWKATVSRFFRAGSAALSSEMVANVGLSETPPRGRAAAVIAGFNRAMLGQLRLRMSEPARIREGRQRLMSTVVAEDAVRWKSLVEGAISGAIRFTSMTVAAEPSPGLSFTAP